METGIELVERSSAEHVFRINYTSSSSPANLLILLHGWTGNEKSMDLFVKRFQSRFFVLSPRGHISAGLDSFGWCQYQNGVMPDAGSYSPAADILLADISEIISKYNYRFNKIRVIGFSQGAALAYTLAIKNSKIFKNLACLSGYLPSGLLAEPSSRNLDGSRFFITHGIQDPVIPVLYARDAVKSIRASGGDAIYCEENGGHKLSLGCLKELEKFIG